MCLPSLTAITALRDALSRWRKSFYAMPFIRLDDGYGMLKKEQEFFDYTGIFRFINYFYTVYYFIRQIYAAIVIDFVPNVTNRPLPTGRKRFTGNGLILLHIFL